MHERDGRRRGAAATMERLASSALPGAPERCVADTVGDFLSVKIRESERRSLEELDSVAGLVAALGHGVLRGRAGDAYDHRKPPISVRDYLHRIATFSMISPTAIMLAFIYLMRLTEGRAAAAALGERTVHRLLLACCLVASKFYDDRYASNKHWAKVGGLSLGEVNRLERVTLQLLQHKLAVHPMEWNRHRNALVRFAKHKSLAFLHPSCASEHTAEPFRGCLDASMVLCRQQVLGLFAAPAPEEADYADRASRKDRAEGGGAAVPEITDAVHMSRSCEDLACLASSTPMSASLPGLDRRSILDAEADDGGDGAFAIAPVPLPLRGGKRKGKGLAVKDAREGQGDAA